MGPRADVSDERKSQILNTAEDVFAAHGFDGAKMDLIAERAGMSKGAIYWYFKKKDDIIAALLERVFRRSLETLRKVAAKPGPVRERLLEIGRQISLDYEGMTKLMPIALEFYAIALRRKSIRRHLGKLYEELLTILVPLVEEGVRSGELAPVDPHSAAILLISAYEGLGVVWTISPNLVNWKSHGPEMAATLLTGLVRR
jgi:TetR/AcrR family acrAB operon transcriptional repressor